MINAHAGPVLLWLGRRRLDYVAPQPRYSIAGIDMGTEAALSGTVFYATRFMLAMTGHAPTNVTVRDDIAREIKTVGLQLPGRPTSSKAVKPKIDAASWQTKL